MTTHDARSAGFAEADDDMFAEGTALTVDRAVSLEKLSDVDDLDDDDRANLVGLAGELQDELREARAAGGVDAALYDGLVERLDGVRDGDLLSGDPGAASSALSDTLAALADRDDAYDADPVRSLADRLDRRGSDAEAGASVEGFAAVVDDPAALLRERGYGERVVEQVGDIVTAGYRDIGRERDYIGDIDRLEGLSSGDPDNSSFHGRLVFAYMSRYQVERDAGDGEAASESFDRMQRHLAAVDAAELGILDQESLVRKLASDPDSRHLGEPIVRLAGEAASQLEGFAAEYEQDLRSDRAEMALANFGRGDDRVALGSHYVERGLVMSGVVASYGEVADAEEPLQRWESSGRTAQWDAATLAALAERRGRA